jgi:hypothetical protein
LEGAAVERAVLTEAVAAWSTIAYIYQHKPPKFLYGKYKKEFFFFRKLSKNPQNALSEANFYDREVTSLEQNAFESKLRS